MKRTKYNWLLSFPGYWTTKEGHSLSKIDKPAKRSFAWYKFQDKEFEVQGSFQAQLKAEEIIKEARINYCGAEFKQQLLEAVSKYGDEHIDVAIEENIVYGFYHSEYDSFGVTVDYTLSELDGIEAVEDIVRDFDSVSICEN